MACGLCPNCNVKMVSQRLYGISPICKCPSCGYQEREVNTKTSSVGSAKSRAGSKPFSKKEVAQGYRKL